ncbi:MAG: site-specific DNA-methyltransferase [Methylobacterium sp.]|nr:site-specific DNA-methyltransferase [Methylobacterium sp.]
MSAVTFLDGKVELRGGDCLALIRAVPDCSIDSIVTDPPYALVSIVKRFGKAGSAPAKGNEAYARASAGFMGKAWDTGDVAFAVEFWAECLRVLKPGGHVAAFSGTRTYHRLACAIEDAGFEIRDQLAWVYGTGFPKSHDVSKAIDRHNGDLREKVRVSADALTNPPNLVGGAAKGADRPWREKALAAGYHEVDGPSAASAAWQGWGTALKPAWETICLARKPLIGTVAENVLAHGTGAINVDACRVDAGGDKLGGGMASMGRPKVSEGWDRPWMHDKAATDRKKIEATRKVAEAEAKGRFPANILHDGSAEVVECFPETSASSGQPRNNGEFKSVAKGRDLPHVTLGHADAGGSAARFFYSAKADKDDRLGSKHPTVKPVDLMQWLCRLITPPGGLVLDPFAGTGTTGEAAWRGGFRALLFEREVEYQADIARRMALALAGPKERAREAAKARGLVADAGGLFGGLDDGQRGGQTDLRPLRRSRRSIGPTGLQW